MARPSTTTFAEAVYARLAPIATDDERLGWPLLTFVTALATMFEAVESISRSTGLRVPYSQLLDVETCPPIFLPFLAQFAGVTLRPATKLVTDYNLIANSSVEAASTSFAFNFNASLNRVLGGSWGSHMLRAAATANGTVGVTFSVAWSPYAEITGSVDVIATAKPLHLVIEFSDDTFNPLATYTTADTTAIGRRALTATAPAGTAYAAFEILRPSSLIGETFDLDGFRLSLGDQSDYFDGDFPGAQWLIPSDISFSFSSRARVETLDEWAIYARDAIRRRSGRRRGTIDAMRSAIEETLSDTQTVRLIERVGGDAYALEAVTRPSETGDADATLAAALTQKPAGIVLTMAQSDLPLIDEGTRTIDAASATIDDATLADVT